MAVPVVHPSVVRDMLLAEHEALRDELTKIEGILDRGKTEATRDAIAAFLGQLSTHIDTEDRVLPDVLREDFAWGELRVQKMFEHHRAQREQIEQWRQRAREVAASNLVTLVQEIAIDIREDMVREDTELLTSEVMRDDPVRVAFGG